ncbi:MAG: leucine-rich repeat protein [Clostridia bacterium]|nr:leucine-rich repeat protein [Clostridia bacterium]
MTAPAFVLDIGYFPRKNLETVVINGGETLPQNCFRECNKLINITIPDSVEIIGAGAFSDCENLAEADLGQGLTEIQGYGYACI